MRAAWMTICTDRAIQFQPNGCCGHRTAALSSPTMSEPADPEVRDAPARHVQSASPASKPRWVAPLGITAVVLFVVVLVLLHATGAIGPGAH
jgi:hypothetical protein